MVGAQQLDAHRMRADLRDGRLCTPGIPENFSLHLPGYATHTWAYSKHQICIFTYKEGRVDVHA